VPSACPSGEPSWSFPTWPARRERPRPPHRPGHADGFGFHGENRRGRRSRHRATEPGERTGSSRMTDLCEVVITAPDPEWLADLTRALVAEGLCASAHNFAPVLSVYRWQGQIHERTEGRASLHTRAELVSRIVDRVRTAGHPYEVPGISARPISGGNPDYLQWIADATDLPTSAGDLTQRLRLRVGRHERREAPEPEGMC
jgi:periplasmic divalent cation tolerance protein